MFLVIAVAFNVLALVAGATGEIKPGMEGVEDFIPCC
jgi:hypothetical protein